MTYLTGILIVTAALLGTGLLLDRALPHLLHWLAPLLPNEAAGRDGWFVDTQHGNGIFDKRSV